MCLLNRLKLCTICYIGFNAGGFPPMMPPPGIGMPPFPGKVQTIFSIKFLYFVVSVQDWYLSLSVAAVL